MRFKKVALFACVLVVTCLVLSAAAMAADDPQNGTWELNTEKSKYSGPAPKANTLTIAVDEKTYKLHAEGVDAQGKPTKADFTAGLDGKDVPATGLPYGDTVSV